MGMKEFSDLIRAARGRRGIRAYDLAFKLGQTPSWLSKLESGSLTHPPAPEVLEGIGKALDLSMAEMLTALGYRVLAEDAPPYDDTAASIARAVAHWSPAKKRFLWSFIDAVDAASLERAEPYDDDDDGPTEATGD